MGSSSSSSLRNKDDDNIIERLRATATVEHLRQYMYSISSGSRGSSSSSSNRGSSRGRGRGSSSSRDCWNRPCCCCCCCYMTVIAASLVRLLHTYLGSMVSKGFRSSSMHLRIRCAQEDSACIFDEPLLTN